MAAIDIDKLSRLLREQRGGRNLSDIAEEIGEVSISTLSRIEKGKIPDLSTFIKICSWLKLSPNDFAPEFEKEKLDHQSKILYHLRADNTLTNDVSESLLKMIQLAYQNSELINKEFNKAK